MQRQNAAHKHSGSKALLALTLALTSLGSTYAQEIPIGCFRPKSEEVNGKTTYPGTPVVSSPPLSNERPTRFKFILTSDYPFHGINLFRDYVQLKVTPRTMDFTENNAIGWAHMSTLIKVDPAFCR